MFIVYAIIIFAFLIFVHELGHFLTARAVGIRVREFAIGMGPKLLKKQKGETLYSLRAFPIGGFCAMEGEDEDSDDPRAFNNRPIPARAIVLVAGSLMNILLAIVLLSIVVFSGGQPVPTVKEFTSESHAAEAGLRPGDTVRSINGEKVQSWQDLSGIVTSINAQHGTLGGDADSSVSIVGGDKPTGSLPESVPLTLVVRGQDGKDRTVVTNMYFDPEAENYKIGIIPKISRSPGFAVKSIGYGAAATWEMSKMMYGVLGQLVTGRTGIDQLTGPVGIVKTVGDAAKYGFIYILQLAALISLNLGIVNLLPFPALDGGRILFLIIRLFTGKRISDSVEGKIHLAGILLLFGLMIFVTVLDVDRFILQ
ncbi:MAG: RIP metalloprotease RseP [Clostridiales Family XIII bacterium]|nr:RIP metalloprotease RseP [Clostridiales Family XIII bacterium]